MNFTVYKHTSPSNKIYIGITSKNVKDRWQNGKGYIRNKYFYRAIQKYGWENFKHEILFENLTKEEACQKEIELIAEYKSNQKDFGYNIATGGEHNSGFTFKHTDEAKKKIGDASRGHITSEEQKQKISKARKGIFKHTEEAKEKLRQKALKQFMTKEAKQKISSKIKKLWEEGFYDNMSIKHKGQKAWNKGLTKDDPRVAKSCRKVGEWHPSEETKKRMSDARKGKKPVNCRKVICIETNEIFNSIAEASRNKNINNIGKALTNEKYTAGGYHWKYFKEE
jgi:group I intron endonuclease